MSDLFLDSSFAIALSNVNDQHHRRALRLADRMELSQSRFITTQAVLLEIGNALAKRRFRAGAVALLQSIQNDPRVEVVTISEDLFAWAFQIYRTRPDKEWGLIDCLSFTVMADRQMGEALTADEHFQQAGFRALLREVEDG